MSTVEFDRVHSPSAPGRKGPVAVLGGGPAGLTAGYLLAKKGVPVIVFEAEDQVGGLAKTEVRDGYRFDLGGHRFFTKSEEVNELWHEVMREEFLLRPRMSRIFWNGKFLDYPLNGRDVIKKLGPVELIRSGLSYLWALVKPKGREDNFEEWVSNRFGKRLFNLFFKSYTEKVWGVPTTEIRAEWAAQRIKGLSFFSAAKAAFFGNKGDKVKSLITQFHYPRFGPGQMWETMADEIIAAGGEVRLNAPVQDLEVRDGRVDRGDRRRRAHRAERGHLLAAPARHHRALRRGRGGRGPGRGAGPALPRLPHRRARDRRRGPVPRQLDLHPRAVGRGRADPELPLLEPLDGPGRVQGLRRPRVLLLLGRRALGLQRRGARRAGQARARPARPGRPGEGRARLRHARAARLSDVRRRLLAAGRRDPRLARGRRPTSSRSGATGCTATTTPTTRC